MRMLTSDEVGAVAGGREEVMVDVRKMSEVEKELCKQGFAIGGAALGWYLGKQGGAWLGSAAGGFVGFLATPVLGPAAPIAGTATGFIAGSHHGGKAGFFVGNVVGQVAGAYACNDGGGDTDDDESGKTRFFVTVDEDGVETVWIVAQTEKKG